MIAVCKPLKKCFSLDGILTKFPIPSRDVATFGTGISFLLNFVCLFFWRALFLQNTGNTELFLGE